MASEIKYLSYEGLDYFWKNKLKPIIEENEEVTAAALTDLDNRLNTHTHMYVASAGYAAATDSILSNGTITTKDNLNTIPIANQLRYNIYTNGSDTELGFQSNDGIVLTGCFNTPGYAAQLALDDNAYNIAFRYKSNSSWSGWKKLAFVDGTGATGTWPISIAGNAAIAANAVTAGRAIYSASAGYIATAANAVTAGRAIYSASAGYAATAARSVTAGRAIYSASAGYVATVRLYSTSGSTTLFYPMVFTTAASATTGASLYIDSSTGTTETSAGIRYNPYYNRCYCSGGFYEASDERLKNFGDDIEVDLDKLSQLSKKYFTWKDDKSNIQQIGVSAQEVQKLYPEIVNIVDEDGHLSVSYDKLSVVALKGIDILNDKIKSLDERLERLEKLIKE